MVDSGLAGVENVFRACHLDLDVAWVLSGPCPEQLYTIVLIMYFRRDSIINNILHEIQYGLTEAKWEIAVVSAVPDEAEQPRLFQGNDHRSLGSKPLHRKYITTSKRKIIHVLSSIPFQLDIDGFN